MTDTPTGTGDLIKRLRGPVQQAAKDLIDTAFNNRNGRGVQFSIPARPDEDTDLVLVKGIKDAADALEAAERVIAELADDLKASLDAEYGYKLDYPSMKAKYERGMAPVYAAKDWLARHTTQRQGGDDE